MKQNYNSIKKFIWDLLFPIKCVECNKEGDWLCISCSENIKIYNETICPICGSQNVDGSVCGYCRQYSCLDGLFVVFEDGKLPREIINLLKYNFVVDVLADLDFKFSEYLNKNPIWKGSFVLVPVPLHRRRFLYRGFNQADVICEQISGVRGNRVNNILKRVKYNKPQVGLSAVERERSVAGIFEVNGTDYDFNKTIVLVDDIYTTGSTMNECAKELKKAGHKKVWGLVLIRG